jgi:biopolymer transport protein ExbD
MPLKTTVDDPPAINMIPMIDIMFNLIIFFLVGTEFASMERNIALRVPEVVDKGALTSAPERRVVNVFRDGNVTLDETPVTLIELTDRLATARRQYSDLGVLVRGDGQGTFQRVAEVLNACKQAGIQELGISVRLIAPEK